MATFKPQCTPTPRYKNTIVCAHCHAEYDPTARWVYGFYPPGSTADEFTSVGTVPEGVCPVCRQPK